MPKELKLKNQTELGELLKDPEKTLEYIYTLHLSLQEYQIVIDAAINTNKNVKY